MKQPITIISVLMVSIIAMAQNNAEIAVSYTTNEPNFQTGNIEVHHKYVLLANATESKFFSPRTEYIDSLRSTPEGEAKYKEMARNAVMAGKFNDMPKRDGTWYVLKNTGTGQMTTYDVNGIERYRTEETLPKLEWQISDETRNIIGYECQKASTNFHGREWIVWFTPDVPIMNGPWKLGGLPGIILEATDKSGTFSFIADGIQKSDFPILPVYRSEDYDKIDRIEFLKAKRNFLDNPVSQMNAQLSGSRISINSSGKGLQNKPREEVDFIETDY